MAYLREDLLSGNKMSTAGIGTAILPGWGTLLGYGTGAILDDINRRGGLWDYIKYPVTRWQDIEKMNFGDIVTGLLDPGGALFDTGDKPKKKSNAESINELIDKYREAGLQGIAQMGQQEREAAMSRLAASGLDPSIALKQALLNPILQKLSGARTQLEGQLAQTEAGMQEGELNRQFQQSMMEQQNQQNMFAGILDMIASYINYNKLQNQAKTTPTTSNISGIQPNTDIDYKPNLYWTQYQKPPTTAQLYNRY